MEIVNLSALDRAIRKHRDTAKWLSGWAEVVRSASWQSLRDVRRQYPSADGVTLKSRVAVTVFNVKGNEYRILTIIQHQQQRVIVVDVLSHAEYDKQQWKERL